MMKQRDKHLAVVFWIACKFLFGIFPTISSSLFWFWLLDGVVSVFLSFTVLFSAHIISSLLSPHIATPLFFTYFTRVQILLCFHNFNCRRCYIRFIRKINDKKGIECQEETKKAFEFMLNYVGEPQIYQSF